MTAGAKQKTFWEDCGTRDIAVPGAVPYVRVSPPPDTSFTREGGARDAQRICSRSPPWLKTSSPPPSSLNLASAISFPETSFHANPPLPLLIPGEFTSRRASAWRSQPLHMKAFHSSGRQAEGMWSRDTPVSALADGSRKAPPKQMLLGAQSPQPRSERHPAGSAVGRVRGQQGELLPGNSQVSGVGEGWQPLMTACSCCLPRSRPTETPTCCRQLQAVCSSSATTNIDIIAACSHSGREGPGCPAPHFLSPLQIPAGGTENTSSVIVIIFFPTNICKCQRWKKY